MFFRTLNKGLSVRHFRELCERFNFLGRVLAPWAKSKFTQLVQWPGWRAKLRAYVPSLQINSSGQWPLCPSHTHFVFFPSSFPWSHTMQVFHMLRQVQLTPFAHRMSLVCKESDRNSRSIPQRPVSETQIKRRVFINYSVHPQTMLCHF